MKPTACLVALVASYSLIAPCGAQTVTSVPAMPVPKFDVPPGLLRDTCQPLAYPDEALSRGLEGNVTVLVYVTARGKPTSSSVYQSSGSDFLDQATRVHVENCRFSPAQLKGQAVPGSALVPYTWRLEK